MCHLPQGRVGAIFAVFEARFSRGASRVVNRRCVQSDDLRRVTANDASGVNPASRKNAKEREIF